MKLNLWMIANRLSELEPELHIPENAPAALQSARRAYATKCVYIYQKGRNVICDAGTGGGYIVFRDMECDQIFEMVQFTFDFYREWQEMLFDAANQLDYQKMISGSWRVFHNPMILLDASNTILAMSEQYGEDEVNNDWKYLCRHGHSSVQVIQYLMEEGRRHGYYLSGRARIYHFDGQDIDGNMMSAAIYCGNEMYGRINVVEKDRPLNPGDVILLDYVVKYLSAVLGKLSEDSRNPFRFAPTLTKMLENQPVTEEELFCWREYTRWSESEEMVIVVLAFWKKACSIQDIISLRNLLQSSIPCCTATQEEENVVFAVKNPSDGGEADWKVVEEIAERLNLRAGVSLPFSSTRQVYYAHRQAQAAVRYGILFQSEKRICRFYDYAIEYIISVSSLEEAAAACEPDIKRMWIPEEPKGGEKIETLRVYLNNERSLIHTANELFLHRNTLVYRMKKITDALRSDLNEVYTQDYMKLSIRVLRLAALERGKSRVKDR